MIWKNENFIDKEIIERISNHPKLPKHIAIIMDGNGRWAEEKNLPRLSGHKEGIESVRSIVRAASLLGIEYLTLYAFSIENWKRPSSEVNGLMKLLEFFLKKDIEELNLNEVVLKTIGRTSSLPKTVQNILFNSIEKTKNNNGMKLVLALSYGSRWDILRATQLIALESRRGKISPEDITEEFFRMKLNTSDIPDPDLLIRTSGEMRISNFLLWELAYSEIFVTDKLWPDYRKEDFIESVECFLTRERRFGLTSSQLNSQNKNNNIDINIKLPSNKSIFGKLINAFK